MERRGFNSKGVDYVSRFLEEKYRLIISEESKKNIDIANNDLEGSKNLSLCLGGNHTTFEDSIFLGGILNHIDPGGTRRIMAPMSHSHTDEKHPIKNSATIWMKDIAEDCNVTTYPVIQTYQIGKQYSATEAYAINKIMFRDLRTFHKNGVPVAIIIFPEGHRSKNGALIKAEQGIVSIAKESLPILFIPVGIDYKGKSRRNFLNFNKQVEVIVGKPYLIENIDNNGEIFEEMMGGIARILPEEKRGEYAYLAQIPEIRG